MKHLIALAAVLVTATGASAQQAKYLCTKMNGTQIKATSCEPLVKPTASPAPTPPPAAQCPPDRTFRTGLPGLKPGDLGLLGKTYPYDQKIELCATLPVAAKSALLFSSTNHANAACNVYDVWMISPSGKYYQSRSTQPGTSAQYEAGQWKLAVYLDSTDAACSRNWPLDLFLSPF